MDRYNSISNSVSINGWLKSMLAIALVFALLFFSINSQAKVMSLSLSTDGNYIVTVDDSKQVVFWDVANKTSKAIDKEVNIYSAYFIRNSPYYAYQKLEGDEVIIRDLEHNILKRFSPGFPSYGQVITSDLSKYFASDSEYRVYKVDLTNNQQQLLHADYCRLHSKEPRPKIPHSCSTFLSTGKLFSLMLSSDDSMLIGTESSSTYIWNTETGKDIWEMDGAAGKTFITFSPDDKYIVSSNEMSRSFICDIESDKCNKFFLISYSDNHDTKNYPITGVTVIKFIDSEHALSAHQGVPKFPYVTLFNPKKLQPDRFIASGALRKDQSWAENEATILKHFKIDSEEENLLHGITFYDMAQTLDTSPSAHILATGMQRLDGIMVFKYDPEKQELTRIWAPKETNDKQWRKNIIDARRAKHKPKIGWWNRWLH